MYQWIQAAWTTNDVRKNGSIVASDYNLVARSEREFFDALITEVTIPAMDAASKNQCYMTVKFAPEMVRMNKASGKVTSAPVAATKEMWLASNFRLEIAGLDCSKVSAIGSFGVRRAAAADTIGDARILSSSRAGSSTRTFRSRSPSRRRRRGWIGSTTSS